MQTIEVQRRFAAPVERVWEAYTDHARWKEWSGVGKSWLEVEGAPDRNGTGAVRVLGNGPVNAYEEIRDFEPPKRMTYSVIKGGLPMKNHLGEVVFEPDGDGTLVTWRCRFDSRIPGLGGVMRRIVTRVFRDALEGLAKHSFPDAH